MPTFLGRSIIVACAVLALAGSAVARQLPLPPPVRQAIPDMDYIKRKAANARVTPRASGNPLQVRAAAKLAAELGVTCEVVDAAELSARPTRNPDYEIACKDAMGWIITRSGGAPQVNDCLALDTASLAAGKAWPKGMLCALAANAAPVNGLKPLVAKVAPQCELTDGTFLGGGGQPPILRYEVRCKTGAGYIIDTPAPGSTASMSSMTCADAAQAGLACSLKAETDKHAG